MMKQIQVLHQDHPDRLIVYIHVELKSRLLPKSTHPDFEDQPPRRVEYYEVKTFIEDKPFETCEMTTEKDLLNELRKIEEDLIRRATNQIADKYKETIWEKLKARGYVK